MTRFVCFGEILIRLTAPGRELLLQSPQLIPYVGGAEANVAVSLARFGHDARMVSVLPDNPLGEAALGEMRRRGLDTRFIATGPGRMGLYFLSPGAGQRATDITYDRTQSAFANLRADAIDWPAALEGADWLHVSGVTPALTAATADAALAAMKAARAAGVKVSYDANFRAKLWQARGDDPRPTLDALMAEADLAFAEARDFALIAGQRFESNADAIAAAFARYPNLQRIAHTSRTPHSCDHNDLGAYMHTRGAHFRAPVKSLTGIVDRIGGGDAFAAGLLHGLATGFADQSLLEYALAAACLKHYIPGDANLVSDEDVRFFIANPNADVRR
ncbi:MAG TPA: sugar kinase [Terricaulis sp.]|nr:sugar kinase [Terricaulis sp.]HRP09556.1 sugar kinase [Terricaulis sp.]